MIINMTTFAGRRKHYIDRTLESLFKSDGRDIAVNLILGSSDSSHVEQYRNVATLVPWDQEAESQAREGNLRHNCNVNAIRALKHGADDYCLCCEDDVIFDEHWFSQLLMTIGEIDRKDYVLNLAHGQGRSTDKRYATHSQPYLCGAQGLFYPSKPLRRAVAEYVEQNITKATNDTLIGRYAKQYAALYNACPILVRHNGQVSSFSKPPTSVAPSTEEGLARAAKTSVERETVVDRRVDRAPEKPTLEKPATDARGVRREGGGDLTPETLVSLMRASLGREAPPDAARLAACDWRRLELVASHHGLGAILCRALQGNVTGVPSEPLRIFKAQYVANAYRSHVAQTCVGEVGAAFGTEQISVIVMKGAALLRTLYDDPGLRVIGDVDLLVDERDVERASMLLQRMGLQQFASDHEDERGPLCHIHRVYCRPEPRAIPIELHWRLFEPYQPYVFDLDEVRARARQFPGLPANVLVMAPEHELTHLCVHLDRHAVTFRSLVSRQDWRELLLLPQGLGRLVWLYDIALYLQRRSALIDWDSFVDTARRWAMDDRIHATLELSRRVFGVGPPPEVLQALEGKQLRFVEQVAHRLVFASHRANELAKNGSAPPAHPRRLKRLSGHVLRFANTWISIFPTNGYLRAKFARPAAAPLWLRGRQFREVVPGLWAETRDRLGAAMAARRRGAQR